MNISTIFDAIMWRCSRRPESRPVHSLCAATLACFTLAAIGTGRASAESPQRRDLEVLASPAVSVSFRAAAGSSAVTGVDLWVSSDQGRNWKKHADNASPLRPLVFEAAADGEYGLYLVLRNSAGPSADPPGPGTAPQKSVRLDRQAPLVQILSTRRDPNFSINRDLHLRWTAADDNLLPRPVWLHYRSEETKAWRLIAESLEADGSYRWTVPETLRSRLELKVTAKDLAGNIGRSEIQWQDIGLGAPPEVLTPATTDSISRNIPTRPAGDEEVPAPPQRATSTPARAAPLTKDPPAARALVDPTAEKRAEQLYDMGTWHRVRGEYDLARLRLSEAVRANPNQLNARNDLAGVLLLLRDRAAAEREYLAVLEHNPAHLAALKGLALLQTADKRYETALRTLHRLVEAAPDDAEGWLCLGDVRLFAGNRPSAREAWKKAADLPTASPAVRTKAGKRLEIYSGSTAEPAAPSRAGR